MEITIKDLKFFKLSPTLILFLKAVYNKDNKMLKELADVIDIKKLAIHLEKLVIIKISSYEVNYSSYEIRKKSILTYFKKEEESVSIEHLIDEVIDYFKQVTGKTKVMNKSDSNRKFVKARLRDYSVQDLKDVIDLKNKHTNEGSFNNEYLRISTLFNEEKFQGYIGAVEKESQNKSRIILG